MGPADVTLILNIVTRRLDCEVWVYYVW